MQQHLILYTCLLLTLAFTACKKEFTDPSGPSSDQAFSSVNAITDVAVGLQNWYTANRTSLVYNRISASGLVTNELVVVNAGNTDEAQLGKGGGSVLNTNAIVTGIWTVSNKIIYDANNIIRHLNIVSDKNYASGLIAYSNLYKAMAIADMAMFWDHVPDTIGAHALDSIGTNVPFITSNQALNKAIALLDNALASIAANPISAGFKSNVTGGIDITNTLYALKARYSLMAGNYAQALSAANSVDLTVKSSFNYNQLTLNPVYLVATSTNNVYQPVDSTMGLPKPIQPDLADGRIYFYMTKMPKSSTGFGVNGFFAATSQPIPVYLPGEITLIKAECYARQNDLNNGLAELNKVITKKASADPFGVGAGLPAITGPLSQQDLLTQIYRNRCIELFMSGLKLTDMRRFGRPDSEKKRNYFPYPFVERNDNVNTPPDPPF